MQESIDYIIDFLTSDHSDTAAMVGYCSDPDDYANYRITIVASGFFSSPHYGTKASLPTLPLKELNGIPILYGEPRIERIENRIVLHADIVASTYFMISRYEELTLEPTDFDEHSRPIGKKSFAARAGFLMRPIVDEYRNLLRSLLAETGVSLPPIQNTFSQINLTHDVDSISHYRRLRGFAGGLKRLFSPDSDNLLTIFRSLRKLSNDPAQTFDFITANDAKLTCANKIYFLKAATEFHPLDYPKYSLTGKDFNRTIKLITSANPDARFGLHTSYASGSKPELIEKELEKLTTALNTQIYYNRYHYLRSTSPDDMTYLADNDITDDYTIAYADTVGFRLGTTRTVQWINPTTRHLTALHLHPLTIMDCTLSNSNYMNLNEADATKTAMEIIETVRKYNGELTLLWHNTTFNQKNTYHKRLYTRIIEYLATTTN